MGKIGDGAFLYPGRGHDSHELGSRGALDVVRAFGDELTARGEMGVAVGGADERGEVAADVVAVHQDGPDILVARKQVERRVAQLPVVVGIHVGEGAVVHLSVVPPFDRLDGIEGGVAAHPAKLGTGHARGEIFFHHDRLGGVDVEGTVAGHEGEPFGLVGVDREGADVVEAARPVVNGYQGAVVQPRNADIVGVGLVHIGHEEFLPGKLCRQRLFYKQVGGQHVAVGEVDRPAAFEHGNALAVACLDAGAGQVNHKCVDCDVAGVEGMPACFYRPCRGRNTWNVCV